MSRDVEYDLRNVYFAALEKQSPSLLPAIPHGRPDGAGDQRPAGGAHALRPGHHVQHQHGDHRPPGALILMARINPRLMLSPWSRCRWWRSPRCSSAAASTSSSRSVQEKFADISARVQENLAGVRVVRAYAREAREEDDFARVNDDYLEGNRRLVAWSVGLPPPAPGAHRPRVRGGAVVRRPAGDPRPDLRRPVRHLPALPRQADLADDRPRLGDQPGAARHRLARPHPQDPRRRAGHPRRGAAGRPRRDPRRGELPRPDLRLCATGRGRARARGHRPPGAGRADGGRRRPHRRRARARCCRSSRG